MICKSVDFSNLSGYFDNLQNQINELKQNGNSNIVFGSVSTSTSSETVSVDLGFTPDLIIAFDKSNTQGATSVNGSIIFQGITDKYISLRTNDGSCKGSLNNSLFSVKDSKRSVVVDYIAIKC